MLSDFSLAGGIQEFVVIDGQQRLTTMMILLKALLDIAKANKDNIESEIYECLYNRYCDEQLKIKLKPIKTDDEQFKLLLNDNLDAMNKIGNIYENYTFFLNTIKKDNLSLL